MKSENIQFAGKQVKNLLKILEADKPIGHSNAAVFFDIDGTISRNDSLELLISEAVKRDLLPTAKEEVFEKMHQLWKNREVGFEDYLKNVIELISYLKFFSYDILKKLAHDAIQNNGSYFYLFPWMLLLNLKALGYKLIAISGAPEFMAKMYLDKICLFPDEVNGSKYTFKDNVFTGELDISILQNKGGFIEKKYRNLFDFENCIALGDTISDASMFHKISKVVAINPTHALAVEAKTNKWPVIVERKDLVLLFPEGQLEI